MAWLSGILTPNDVLETLKPRLKAVIAHTDGKTLGLPVSDLLIVMLKGFGAKFVLERIEAMAKDDFDTWGL